MNFKVPPEGNMSNFHIKNQNWHVIKKKHENKIYN